jgi:hypothetical protein
MISLLREVRIQQKGCGVAGSDATSMSQPAVMLICVPNLLLLRKLQPFPNQSEGHG